tara:strand:- start:180 stop:602 length:423 start_codon:yes stop_codon:yes gene_type:complete
MVTSVGLVPVEALWDYPGWVVVWVEPESFSPRVTAKGRDQRLLLGGGGKRAGEEWVDRNTRNRPRTQTTGPRVGAGTTSGKERGKEQKRKPFTAQYQGRKYFLCTYFDTQDPISDVIVLFPAKGSSQNNILFYIYLYSYN